MCFYTSMSKRAMQVAARYGRKTNLIDALRDIIEEKRQNGELEYGLNEEQYITSALFKPLCMVVTKDEQLGAMNWGLRPQSMKLRDKEKYDKGNWFVNARSEEIFETFPYKYEIHTNRCIIPCTGYYEFHYGKDKKAVPFYFRVLSEEIFSMAGIYDRWINSETNEEMFSFAQITTEANPLAKEIHNGGKHPFRMPVILPKEVEEQWLNPDLSETDIKKLLAPYPAVDMEAFQVASSYKEFMSLNPFDEKVLER